MSAKLVGDGQRMKPLAFLGAFASICSAIDASSGGKGNSGMSIFTSLSGNEITVYSLEVEQNHN